MTAKPEASRNGSVLLKFLKVVLNYGSRKLGLMRRRRIMQVRRLPEHLLKDIGVDPSGMGQTGFEGCWKAELNAQLRHDQQQRDRKRII